MSTPELSGPPAPGQTEPGPFPEPASDTPLDGGLASAWRDLARTIGRRVPDEVNATIRARRRIRAAGRR